MFETLKVDDKQNRALNEATELIYQEQLSEWPEQMGDYKKRMSRYMISRIEKFIVTMAVGSEVQRLRRLFWRWRSKKIWDFEVSQDKVRTRNGTKDHETDPESSVSEWMWSLQGGISGTRWNRRWVPGVICLMRSGEISWRGRSNHLK